MQRSILGIGKPVVAKCECLGAGYTQMELRELERVFLEWDCSEGSISGEGRQITLNGVNSEKNCLLFCMVQV